MEERTYLISEVSRLVGVEPHVLRYWEEELDLSIPRNSQGKRCYREGDVAKFREIKFWKDKGMQLKAVKEILEETENGQGDIFRSAAEPGPEREESETKYRESSQTEPFRQEPEYQVVTVEGPSDSARRLEQLLDGIIARSLEKNNEKLVDAICGVILEGLEERLDAKLEEKARNLVEQELMREMVDQAAKESAAAGTKAPTGLWRRMKEWLEKKLFSV